MPAPTPAAGGPVLPLVPGSKASAEDTLRITPRKGLLPDVAAAGALGVAEPRRREVWPASRERRSGALNEACNLEGLCSSFFVSSLLIFSVFCEGCCGARAPLPKNHLASRHPRIEESTGAGVLELSKMVIQRAPFFCSLLLRMTEMKKIKLWVVWAFSGISGISSWGLELFKSSTEAVGLKLDDFCSCMS